jgi:hypothetical protein
MPASALIVWSYSEIFVFVIFFILFTKVTKPFMVIISFFVYLCAAYTTIVLLFGHTLTTDKAK